MWWVLLIFVAVARADENPGYSYKSCERADLNRATIPFSPDGSFRPECAPDTLYSWGSESKIRALADGSTPQNVLPAKYLYTWRTPIGSFGYGDIGVRIKLRPDVKFKLVENPMGYRTCGEGSLTGENTVFVAYLNWYDFSEYILCGSSAVESWSYGHEDFLREMSNEKQWMESHSKDEFDSIRHASDCDKCYLGFGYDGKDGSLSRLLKNFDAIKKVIENKEGRIFYAEGVENSVDKHFQSGKPTYFNFRKSEAPASTKEAGEAIWPGAPI